MTKKNLWWEQLKHIRPECSSQGGDEKIKSRKCLKCGKVWDEHYTYIKPSGHGLCAVHKGDTCQEEWGVL